jgi:GNAT superfamily N-acetyltransferase
VSSAFGAEPPKVTIEIAAVKELAAGVRKELIELSEQQFGGGTFTWAEPQWFAYARSMTQIASSLKIYARDVAVGGQPTRVGGIGGVLTQYQWRNQGIASRVLRAAAQFIALELKLDFTLLVCRPEVAPVYAKLGWQIVAGPTSFCQPTGRAIYPRLTMVRQNSDQPWPGGPIDLCGLPW